MRESVNEKSPFKDEKKFIADNEFWDNSIYFKESKLRDK